MKNKFTGSLCVLMCVIMVFSMLAACSVKDKTNDDTTNATLTPDNSWTPGVDSDYVYESIQISKVELVELVKDALGDEIADDWNGDLNSLTPEQLEKVEQHATNEGLKVELDANGNPVIKKDEVVTNAASQDEINQLLTKASVKDPSNISDEEYERLSQVAQSEGYILGTKPAATNASGNEETKKNDINIVKPVTTIIYRPTQAATNAQTAKPTKAEKTTAKPILTTKPVVRTTSVYRPPTSPNTVAPMAPVTTGIPASTRDWVSTFKKSTNEVFTSSVATPDGGVVATGITYAAVSDSIDDGGVSSAMIVKYNKKGNAEWSRIIGGSKVTSFEDVAVLSDGSIIAVGYTLASDLQNAGEYKCPGTIEGIIAKFNNKGDLLGNIKIMGGSSDDFIYSVAPTTDGGFIIGGKTESVDGDMDKADSPRVRKSFIFKCNSNGSIAWRSFLNSEKGLAVRDLAINNAGGIYGVVECAGVAYYRDKLINGTDKCVSKSSIALKLTPSGDLEWYKTIYGSGMTGLLSIEISTDGGCVLAGQYTSGRNGNDIGSFQGIYNAGTTGTTDGMLVKLNPSGQNGEGVVGWTCPLRGFESDFVTDIVKIDGGFAVSGYTASTNRDFDMMPNSGDYDSFVYIITDFAELRDVYIYNGSGSDNARTVCTNGESIFVAGSTNSDDAAFVECEAKGTEASAVGFVGKLTFKK